MQQWRCNNTWRPAIPSRLSILRDRLPLQAHMTYPCAGISGMRTVHELVPPLAAHLILSYMEIYGSDDTLDDIFIPPYNTTITDIDDGTYNSDEMYEMLPKNPPGTSPGGISRFRQFGGTSHLRRDGNEQHITILALSLPLGFFTPGMTNRRLMPCRKLPIMK